MLKISIIENDRKRQVVLEGKLVAPWTNELKNFGEETLSDGDNRELIIDLRSVTALSAEGEDVLLLLADQGARFRVSGVFMRQVVKQLARRSRLAKGTTEVKAVTVSKQGRKHTREDRHEYSRGDSGCAWFACNRFRRSGVAWSSEGFAQR